MKIKNVLLSSLFIVFVMAGTTANAQLKFGLRGEVGLNKPSISKGVVAVENLNAFKIGPTVEFMMPLVGFGVDGSILYSNEKMNVESAANGNISAFNLEIQEHFIDIPVNLKYKFGIISPIKVYAAVGPYAQFKVGGDDVSIPGLTQTVEDKKFQAGLNFGLGAEIVNRVQLGFNYRLKLTDDYSVSEPTWTDLLNDNKGFWSLTAAVYF